MYNYKTIPYDLLKKAKQIFINSPTGTSIMSLLEMKG